MASDAKATAASDKRYKADQRKKAHGGRTQPADWSTADPQLLCATVVAISHLGGAIRFGYTRDGGAYAVGIYGDGEYRNEYIRPDEDINDYLGECIEAWGTDDLAFWAAERRAELNRPRT